MKLAIQILIVWISFGISNCFLCRSNRLLSVAENRRYCYIRDRNQVIGENLSIFVAQDIHSIVKSATSENFEGIFSPLPTLDELVSSSTFEEFIFMSVAISLIWSSVGIAANIYRISISTLKWNSIVDITNQQFVSTCNTFLFLTFSYLMLSKNPVDLELLLGSLFLSYIFVLSFRLTYFRYFETIK